MDEPLFLKYLFHFQPILIVLILVYVAILAIGFLFPKTTTMQGEISADAAPSEVFPFVATHQQMQLWSPWAGLDPAMQVEFSGAGQGVGAQMTWQSNHAQVGTGSAEYITWQPNQAVRIQLRFIGGEGRASVNLTPVQASDGEQTQVTWSFEQDNNNVFARYISFFLLDSMLGDYYQAGLLKLKGLVEG